MRIIIQKIFLAFFNFIKTVCGTKNTHKNISITNQEYIGAISFKLTKHNDIDVTYALPDIKNKSPEELLEVADNYAKFLMVINQGYLQEDIISIFQSNLKPDDDSKEHLLLDNILVFWTMAELETEKTINNKLKKQQPLIRPSSVFNQDRR